MVVEQARDLRYAVGMSASPLTRTRPIAVIVAAPLAVLLLNGSTYVVQPGDTVTEIAAARQVSVGDIVRANDLQDPDSIHIGERLTIPPAGRSTQHKARAHHHKRQHRKAQQHGANARSGARVPDPSARRVVTYTVQTGDTATGIATRFHAWTAELVSTNHLGPNAAVHVGQRLHVPVVLAALHRNESPHATDDGPTQQHRARARTDDTSTRPHRQPGRHGLPNPSRASVRHIIEHTAVRHGVDPELALAISWQEAGWQQDHLSSAHAVGAMQVIPDTGRWVSSLVGRPLDLRNVHDNVTAGVVLLRQLDRYAARRQMIAGYYQGLSSVRQLGMFSDTRQYVRNVIALTHDFEHGNYPK
ncbi:MAG: lytic transglycosylase [Nocardioidaceae bacterium]